MWNRNKYKIEKFPDTNNDFYMNKLKEEKLKDKSLKSGLKEILLYLVFIALTMSLSYQMLDNDSFKYQYNLRNLFGAGDKHTSFNDVIYLN